LNKPFPANTNKASSPHRRCLSFSPTLHPLPKQTAIPNPAPSQPSKSYPQRPSHNATSYMASNVTAAAKKDRLGGNVKEIYDHSNVTAAASPFQKGCHDSGGVCIPLAEPAQIALPLKRTSNIYFPIHTPRLRRTPLVEGTRSSSPSVSARRLESVSNSLRPSNKQGRRWRPLSCVYFLLLNSVSISSSIFPSFAYGIVSFCLKLQSSGLIELSKPRINRVAIRYMIRVGAKP